jgi:hypothetical protein
MPTPVPRPRKPPLVVKSTTGCDIALAVSIGLALLAFVIWGIFRMSQDVTGNSLLSGQIIAKHFQPQQEEQLTFGKGGLDERDIDGIYTMDIRTSDGHLYKVFVEKPIYQSHQVGDQLNFLPPPPKVQ